MLHAFLINLLVSNKYYTKIKFYSQPHIFQLSSKKQRFFEIVGFWKKLFPYSKKQSALTKSLLSKQTVFLVYYIRHFYHLSNDLGVKHPNSDY